MQKKTSSKAAKYHEKTKARSPPSSSDHSEIASDEEAVQNKKTRKATENKNSLMEKFDNTVAKMVASEADEGRITTAKKRRMSLDGTAIPTSVAIEKAKGHQKMNRKPNAPFQRIKTDQVAYHDERLKDNTFVARNGAGNDYGQRAHQDLIVTRGAGFRKEKNKKKRGSYRGGEITMESHSIKFT